MEALVEMCRVLSISVFGQQKEAQENAVSLFFDDTKIREMTGDADNADVAVATVPKFHWTPRILTFVGQHGAQILHTSRWLDAIDPLSKIKCATVAQHLIRNSQATGGRPTGATLECLYY